MSPIGLIEPFQRLEEFPSFISCIKCFGRPIIPPLLTTDLRHKLQELRTAAVNKEADILKRRKKRLSELEKKLCIPANLCETDHGTSVYSGIHESRALWYPSSKDCPEGISVAISKLPTNGIYSSVHTGAIVCSNVIENDNFSGRIARHSLISSEASAVGCNECSHSNINFECGLCQAEYIQNLHNSFSAEKSPEVPCRTYSLLQSGVNAFENEQNEDTECDSLSTVICNQKSFIHDTDSESNATCLTQSTDLEKYMEFSCEFGSPDNSSAVWDSKSTSQQYSLSRSDDASSETIVNTENELTPCASTLAEFTDNIEDELSTVEGISNVCENKDLNSVTIKRAHSVDSYMKIIQACARNLHVKKSLSEPLDGNSAFSSFGDEVKPHNISKTSHFIKEDSKESDDSKEMPEKDPSCTNVNSDEFQVNSEQTSVSNPTETKSPEKKHIRQSSYTLDEPSSVLIQAHADCTCNFDGICTSPHSSSINNQNEQSQNSAFTKEKVLDIPTSDHQVKKFPILTSDSSLECITLSKEELTSSVVDIFPTVTEDSCEKYSSGNKIAAEVPLRTEGTSETVNHFKMKNEHLNEIPVSVNGVEGDGNQDYFKQIYQELQRSHEVRVKQLFEEQTRQWLKLQEELKEQESLLYEKLKTSVLTPPGAVLKSENQNHSAPSKDVSNDSDKSYEIGSCFEGDKVDVSSSTISSSEQIHVSDYISQNCRLSISEENSQPISQVFNKSQNVRASNIPSSESKTFSSSPSISQDIIEDNENNTDSNNSVNRVSANNVYSTVSQSPLSLRGYLSKTAFQGQPTPINVNPTNVMDVSPNLTKDHVYFCHESFKQCECCSSSDICSEYDINTSQFDCLSISEEQNISYSTVQINDELYPLNNSFSGVPQIKSSTSKSENIENHRKTAVNNVPSKVDSSPKHGATSKSYSGAIKFSNSVNNGNENTVQKLIREKFPVGSILSSLCANTLKNGSFSAVDISKIKQKTIDPALLKNFEKLPAFVKGYLTRRLFKTERVQSLIKTLQDTALLIGKLSEDLSLKGDSVSERDVDFHRQLIVQLMTTFHSVYDIFCTISTRERMNIIAESRNLKQKQKMMEQKQKSEPPVTTKAPVPAPSKKHKLSSATLKALERKRRSNIDSRTYTIEDFRNYRARSAIDSRTYTIEDLKACKLRSRSNTSQKSHSVSPSAIYKNSIGISPKRKTAGSKTSGSRRCLHLKWVP